MSCITRIEIQTDTQIVSFLEFYEPNSEFFIGSPIRTINMYCWSLFRDVDFHNRFHFDHYEFSGQWHGQYRGYQHGRVHQV